MTSPVTPPRDALAAMAASMGIGTLFAGVGFGAQAALCAGLSWLNLALYRTLVWRSTRAVVAEGGTGGGSVASVALALKLPATLLFLFLLFRAVQPLALILGMSLVLGGVAARGAALGRAWESLA